MEVSKVLLILNEDFSFKIEDLINLKEIQKISPEKVSILNSLKEMKLIQISDDFKIGKILIGETASVINLINLPNKVSKESLLKILKIKENSIQRLYKQSLYWTIVCDDNLTNKLIDETLRNVKFEDNSMLKYEFTQMKEIQQKLMKKINHSNYLKEADSLKASGNSGLGQYGNDTRKDSKNWKNSVSSSNEAFSWRKKSDYSSNSKDE